MMKSTYRLITLCLTIVALTVTISAQPSSQENCPLHEQHQKAKADKSDHQTDHHAGVNERGDQAMGFSQQKTTHHFRLRTNGGVIEVSANDPEDAVSRDQIRQHLSHIAQKFAAGDFSLPVFIHAQTPPGVPAMKRLNAKIKYQYEEVKGGGRVRLVTSDAEAIAAIHEFLRFQISDHETGDSPEVTKQ
ncbi:MAG TPA: hypothetical protein VFD58_20060 [Blastocatellia bacterium]|nr:hypothetical protein [Blastocatellia bacterium]